MKKIKEEEIKALKKLKKQKQNIESMIESQINNELRIKMEKGKKLKQKQKVQE